LTIFDPGWNAGDRLRKSDPAYFDVEKRSHEAASRTVFLVRFGRVMMPALEMLAAS